MISDKTLGARFAWFIRKAVDEPSASDKTAQNVRVPQFRKGFAAGVRFAQSGMAATSCAYAAFVVATFHSSTATISIGDPSSGTAIPGA